jgi:hypothetical protein
MEEEKKNSNESSEVLDKVNDVIEQIKNLETEVKSIFELQDQIYEILKN